MLPCVYLPEQVLCTSSSSGHAANEEIMTYVPTLLTVKEMLTRKPKGLIILLWAFINWFTSRFTICTLLILMFKRFRTQSMFRVLIGDTPGKPLLCYKFCKTSWEEAKLLPQSMTPRENTEPLTHLFYWIIQISQSVSSACIILSGKEGRWHTKNKQNTKTTRTLHHVVLLFFPIHPD